MMFEVNFHASRLRGIANRCEQLERDPFNTSVRGLDRWAEDLRSAADELVRLTTRIEKVDVEDGKTQD